MGFQQKQLNRFILDQKSLQIKKKRNKYDKSQKHVSNKLKHADRIVRNTKTDEYIKDRKKRNSILKFYYYGKDDPFYDGLKSIYGEDGLYGYRKQRIDDFENIAEKDVETAAQRYKSVYSSISGIKNIFQIALFIGLWKFYPDLAASGGWDHFWGT